MGSPDNPHFGSPPPTARRTARRPRGDRRLDPVRRRRPSRGTLLRLSAAAALLATAAVTSWSPTDKCGARAPSATAPASASFAAAAPFSSAAAMSAASSPAAAGSTGTAAGSTGTAAGSTGTAAGATAAAAGVVPPGSVGVPVRLADPTALSLVHPGNRVDLLRLDETGASTAVAASALVLRVTGADDPTAGGLLLAVSPAEAQRAVAEPTHGFAILIRPG